MKKYFSIFLLSFVFVWANAQQKPQFSQYSNNTYLNNPAVTGAYDYFDLRLGYRNQWTGFEDAPKTVYLTGHAPLMSSAGGNKIVGVPLPTIGSTVHNPHKEVPKAESGSTGEFQLRHGLGGMLMYDQTGSNNRVFANLSYAIHLPVAQKFYLALGLQAGIINYSQDFGDKKTLNSTQIDKALSDGTINSLKPDLGAGFMLHNKKFYLGFSATQLLASKLKFSDVESSKLFRHYFAQGGIRFNTGQVSFVPFVLLKVLEASPASFDFGVRSFLFDERLLLGLGYRGLRFSGGDDTNGITDVTFKEDAAFVLVGFSINSLIDINYSFDYSFSDLTKSQYDPSSSGSHEISIGFRFNNKVNKQRLF